MRPDGFVLAGGASRRMGRDKARIPGPDGVPLALGVARALAAVCGRVRLVRRAPEAPWGDLEVVADLDLPRHALTGVATAAAASGTARFVVAPCDLVGLTGADVAALWDAADPVAVAEGQPLLGVFEAAEAPALAAAVRGGTPARVYVDGRRAVALPPRALHNVNRPEDLAPPGPKR